MIAGKAAAPSKFVRCAIYTRKSTEEGLDQEFNTLHAQRAAAEAYISSQVQQGWTCLPAHYDDGGFSGGNIDRPALRQLLADIEAGNVDCVLVYRVDRLSRSLLDFSRLLEVFETRGVAFASVTEVFNTSTSAGRLVLNMLFTFAQYERELISERTRHKMAAARRRGQWIGGTPILGYDVKDTKLEVNDSETVQVRQIFELYLKLEGLLPVVEELNRRGWKNKQSVTKDGRLHGGKPFTKTSLHRLLTNVTYIGQVQYKQEIHAGRHQPIVDGETWRRTQALLQQNGRTGGAQVRNQFGALLKGILRCQPCGCAMSPSHSKKGNKRYRYYVCSNAQKRGHATCPSGSIPAHEIEQLVVNQIKCIGQDPNLVSETLAQLRDRGESIPAQDAIAALAQFDAVWSALTPKEQTKLIQLLVERVEYDGRGGRVAITFHRTGIEALQTAANRAQPESAA